MKRTIVLLMTATIILSFGLLLSGCDVESQTSNQGNETASNETQAVTHETVAKPTETGSNLGDYNVEIMGCRLAKDYSGNDIVIVKYNFANIEDDDPASFSIAIEDNVYQDGVGLNQCYFADESADYNSDNSLKEIKKGASIEVEVAYALNDSTTDIEVEVKELFSFIDDTVITKTFSLN